MIYKKEHIDKHLNIEMNGSSVMPDHAQIFYRQLGPPFLYLRAFALFGSLTLIQFECFQALRFYYDNFIE